MGVHGVGRWLRKVELAHLLAHIPRDELDRGLHGGHHALGFLDTLQACLPEVFLLGNGADRVEVVLDIPGNKLAIATDTALQINKVVGMADGTDALSDRFALAREALMLVARGFHGLLKLLQLSATFGGCPGPRFAGVPLALARCSCIRLRLSSALATALSAVRCLAAMGAATALRSSCCTWKRSGE